MNGLELVTMLELATGVVTEDAFAEWLRTHTEPRA